MSKNLTFKDVGPNVKNNLLLVHVASTVNVVEEVFDGSVIKNVNNAKTLLLAFHTRLVEAGMINV